MIIVYFFHDQLWWPLRSILELTHYFPHSTFTSDMITLIHHALCKAGHSTSKCHHSWWIHITLQHTAFCRFYWCPHLYLCITMHLPSIHCHNIWVVSLVPLHKPRVLDQHWVADPTLAMWLVRHFVKVFLQLPLILFFPRELCVSRRRAKHGVHDAASRQDSH